MHKTSCEVCVVGAGLSGLSVATFLANRRPELSLRVLDQAAEPGGAIRTLSDSGYLAEWGAHGFLDNCAESQALLTQAGLTKEITTAPLARFVRYICLDGRLRMIPQKPLAILRQPLVPFSAKLRVLADLWKGPLAGEPSVAQWVAHRFGPALLPFADAVFTGTYAGDIERLSMDAVMPGVRELEREHGSVIRGALHRMRARKQEGGQPRRGLPAMISFSSGMGRLPQVLAARLSEQGRLFLGNGVKEMAPSEGGWRLTTEQGELLCRRLVLALPINRALPLVQQALPGLPPPRTSIPEARIATVVLGFAGQAEIPFGFGYLAPEQEQRFTLGALFSSHMFPGRAPAGHQLLEALVGGRRHPERLLLSDEELIRAVCADLGRLMRLPSPVHTRVLRPAAGIPQLEAGYTGLLAWREQLSQHFPALHLCGFGWKGIGINDMIKEAERVARQICEGGALDGSGEVKGVYF